MRPLASLLSFLIAVLILSAASAELLAGAGKRSIVPPFPMHMGGFGDRLETFEGVHDEIFARALFLDDGVTQIMVIGSGRILTERAIALINRLPAD